MKAIVRDSDGTLSLRFKILGCRFCEKTGYTDTSRNRYALTQTNLKIQDDLHNGLFDYMNHFPHSQNVSIINSLQSRFLSPGWRGLPTFESYYANNYRGTHRVISDEVLRFIVACIGNVKVDEVVGYHLLKLVDVLRNVLDLSQDELGHVISIIVDVLDSAAICYVFPRPFRFSQRHFDRDDYPLSHRDVLRIAHHLPIKYREYFLLKYYLGISTKELLALEWSMYDLHTSSFRLKEKDVYVEPYARRLLFHQMKKTGNFKYVLSETNGTRRSLDLIWVHKICWPKACAKAGYSELGVNVLKKASVAYLFEAGLSVNSICCQTGLHWRPAVHRILTQHIINHRL